MYLHEERKIRCLVHDDDFCKCGFEKTSQPVKTYKLAFKKQIISRNSAPNYNIDELPPIQRIRNPEGDIPTM